MNTRNLLITLTACGSLLSGCGGGSSGNSLTSDSAEQLVVSDADEQLDAEERSGADEQLNADEQFDADDPSDISDPPLAAQARYRVTLTNYWGADEFPQAFPEGAHLSLIGGATHNMAVSFWDIGEVASRGIEDVAEAGLIDQLLFDEVAPAIANGTAASMIEVREFTDASSNGVAGELSFDLDMNLDWPLVSMVTMLGPSPDWFVGVSGLSLLDDDGWAEVLSVDLPIYDGGTKSDITPVMGGPDIIPANPIALVAYDAATGVYLPTDTPQIVARVSFERVELN